MTTQTKGPALRQQDEARDDDQLPLPSVTPPPFQVMPDLAPDEYEALKADIITRGIQLPVLIDEDGEILDGHHRERIGKELGIEVPHELRAGLTHAQKIDLALSLNINRRHLTREQKRDLVERYLKAAPEKSDLQIAKVTGVSDKTVTARRRELEARSEIPNVAAKLDTKGRKRRAKAARVVVHEDKRLEVSDESRARLADVLKKYVEVRAHLDELKSRPSYQSSQACDKAWRLLLRAKSQLASMRVRPEEHDAQAVRDCINSVEKAFRQAMELPQKLIATQDEAGDREDVPLVDEPVAEGGDRHDQGSEGADNSPEEIFRACPDGQLLQILRVALGDKTEARIRVPRKRKPYVLELAKDGDGEKRRLWICAATANESSIFWDLDEACPDRFRERAADLLGALGKGSSYIVLRTGKIDDRATNRVRAAIGKAVAG